MELVPLKEEDMPKDFTLGSRIKNAWNAFKNEEPQAYDYQNLGSISSYRPDRPRLTLGNERSIINSIYNRISIDVAAISIRHARINENGNYMEDIDSGLNNVLTTEANIDQTGRAFVQDMVLTLCDEGCIAVVPIDTSMDPNKTDSYNILSMRVGKILAWYPAHVKVRLYNERTGKKEDLTLPKSQVAIIENPLYSIMNEPNSTAKRLIRKLNLLDAIDEQSGSSKLDLIIQVPYAVKTPAQRKLAEQRKKDIEDQLYNSKYGIVYTDATEHVTQLNRAAENNLMSQIQYLTNMLYSQLGVTEAIINGTATEQEMLNYHNRTIEPILSAITDEFKRKFLTKTARTQGQTIFFFKDPFKLVPTSQIADISDKLTRNEILSSNEVRAIIGYKPSSDPAADELRNKNLNQSTDAKQESDSENNEEEENQNEI
jgi:hypothetical protein